TRLPPAGGALAVLALGGLMFTNFKKFCIGFGTLIGIDSLGLTGAVASGVKSIVSGGEDGIKKDAAKEVKNGLQGSQTTSSEYYNKLTDTEKKALGINESTKFDTVYKDLSVADRFSNFRSLSTDKLLNCKNTTFSKDKYDTNCFDEDKLNKLFVGSAKESDDLTSYYKENKNYIKYILYTKLVDGEKKGTLASSVTINDLFLDKSALSSQTNDMVNQKDNAELNNWKNEVAKLRNDGFTDAYVLIRGLQMGFYPIPIEEGTVKFGDKGLKNKAKWGWEKAMNIEGYTSKGAQYPFNKMYENFFSYTSIVISKEKKALEAYTKNLKGGLDNENQKYYQEGLEKLNEIEKGLSDGSINEAELKTKLGEYEAICDKNSTMKYKLNLTKAPLEVQKIHEKMCDIKSNKFEAGDIIKYTKSNGDSLEVTIKSGPTVNGKYEFEFERHIKRGKTKEKIFNGEGAGIFESNRIYDIEGSHAHTFSKETFDVSRTGNTFEITELFGKDGQKIDKSKIPAYENLKGELAKGTTADKDKIKEYYKEVTATVDADGKVVEGRDAKIKTPDEIKVEIEEAGKKLEEIEKNYKEEMVKLDEEIKNEKDPAKRKELQKKYIEKAKIITEGANTECLKIQIDGVDGVDKLLSSFDTVEARSKQLNEMKTWKFFEWVGKFNGGPENIISKFESNKVGKITSKTLVGLGFFGLAFGAAKAIKDDPWQATGIVADALMGFSPITGGIHDLAMGYSKSYRNLLGQGEISTEEKALRTGFGIMGLLPAGSIVGKLGKGETALKVAKAADNTFAAARAVGTIANYGYLGVTSVRMVAGWAGKDPIPRLGSDYEENSKGTISPEKIGTN
ncbi:MAG: hypothetical protein PHF46_04415, partial [Candidatus Gracilibacteria bacterium]|nr:hypothetical protein [Candidatus Gracilibacteria bacterium]